MARDRIDHWSRRSAASLLLGALMLGAAAPDARAQSTQEILRQRLPDGSVVFTDRAQSGGHTERRWVFEAENPATAAARRAELRSASAEVTERIARQQASDRERELEAELARSRAAQAAAEHEAALARAEAANAPRYVTAPLFWPWPVRPPRSQPGREMWGPPIAGKPRPTEPGMPPRRWLPPSGSAL